MMMQNHLVKKVQKDKLVNCLTCLLCKNFFREATTINECLHTFCKDCIYKKIMDDNLKCCPVCKVELGVAPLDKLKPDNSLQDLTNKIFPIAQQKENRPESNPLATSLTRRKERHVSFLEPEVGSKCSRPGRGKYVRRKNLPLKDLEVCVEEPVRELTVKAAPINLRHSLSKGWGAARQNPSRAQAPKQHIPEEVTVDRPKLQGRSPGYLKILEPTSSARPRKLNSQPNVPIIILSDSDTETDESLVAQKHEEETEEEETEEEEYSSPPSSPSSIEEAVTDEGLIICPQSIVNANSTSLGERFAPVWFSLMASDNQKGDAVLSQIDPCYLRVKDGNVPVQYIKMYIVKKLNLAHEVTDEIEISLQGQVMLPTFTLYDLIERWVKTVPESQRTVTTVGSSAKAFVMVLHYGRKAPRIKRNSRKASSSTIRRLLK